MAPAGRKASLFFVWKAREQGAGAPPAGRHHTEIPLSAFLTGRDQSVINSLPNTELGVRGGCVHYGSGRCAGYSAAANGFRIRTPRST